ncbi:phospholipase-like protein, partial [Tanacetum coccineum]
VKMDDPNITMDIRLKEEKAHRREFPAIVLNDASEATLSCGPTVSPLNDNEMDFRISFDKSDDNNYTPEVSYFNDLDFFKDFENEFPAIVYNDAITSKSDFLTEPTVSPQHIDEFDLKDETSLSECDEEEQNVLYFNDLFPFNVIYPDDLKLNTDNNNKIDIKRPSGDMSVTSIPDVPYADLALRKIDDMCAGDVVDFRTWPGISLETTTMSTMDLDGETFLTVPPGYYTRIDNRPTFREKKPSLEELMNKHLKESTRRRTEMEEWVKKVQENAEINTRNQSASLKNLETQIEQLTKEFHAKTVSEVNNSSFDQCKAVYDDKEDPFNNEINKSHEVSLDQIHMVQEEGISSKILSCQLPPKELNPWNFTLPCTIGSLIFYAMADLGASINVIPKSMFEYLKLARLKKTDMLVEMTDITKRAPIGIVKNVLIKIDKFLFPSDFVVIDMLKTQNETVILERPFLATIHAEIDVFNKEISLGIGDDMVTFDMNRKVNNFTTSVGTIYMINDEPSSSNDTPTDESSRVEKSDDLIQKHDSKKTRILKPNTQIPSAHFCKPIKQICNETLRKSMRWSGLSFPEFLLVRYKRYAEWCNENSNPDTPTSRFTSIQEDYKLRPKDYSFKDWLFTRVGHTDVSEPVKRVVLKTWLIDYFQEELVKDPRSRSFDDYKWMFELEINQLADEYELGIGKKGHMLEDIWENCKKVQGNNTYWWYDQKSEEDERREIGTDIEGYDPPRVYVETFEIKRYSFDSGQNFICVTKELMDALPLGRENRSRIER